MRILARLAAPLLLVGGVASASLGGYVAEIENWREQFDDGVRHDGWLTLVARERIEEGTWTLGSDPRSAIVLPAKAPERLGVLTRHGDTIRFSPSRGVSVTLDGTHVAGTIELPHKRGTGRLAVGELILTVLPVGGDYYLMARDPQNPAIGEFKGTTWYPIDPAYHVAATFEPYAVPETVRVPLTHVDSRDTMQSTGDLVFPLGGKMQRLKTFADDEGLFVMFQDDTNGKSTYGGGRFIEVAKPEGRVTALDFNKAFNPYCSLNANVMCPIPPAQNRLDLSVTAGETFLSH
jgi:uncharacterized protein